MYAVLLVILVLVRAEQVLCHLVRELVDILSSFLDVTLFVDLVEPHGEFNARSGKRHQHPEWSGGRDILVIAELNLS